MKNFTPDLIAKVKTAKSPEELLELAKANGVELTAEEARTYFEQLNASGAVSDDELDAVVGGACGRKTEPDPLRQAGTRVQVIDGSSCSHCQSTYGKIAWHSSRVMSARYVKCESCGTTILNIQDFDMSKITPA